MVRESPFWFMTLPYNVAASHLLTMVSIQLFRASLHPDFSCLDCGNYSRSEEICTLCFCLVDQWVQVELGPSEDVEM